MAKQHKIPLDERLKLGRVRILTCRECEQEEALVCRKCVDLAKSRLEKMLAEQRQVVAEYVSYQELLQSTLETERALRDEIVTLKERVAYLSRDNELLRQTAHLKVMP